MKAISEEQVEFSARVWITESDGVVQYDVWVHELEPVERGRRSSADWIREHLGDMQPEDFRELCDLPKTGCYQVVFKAKMHGWCSWTHDGAEYDQDIEDITEVQFAAIPADWFKEVEAGANE